MSATGVIAAACSGGTRQTRRRVGVDSQDALALFRKDVGQQGGQARLPHAALARNCQFQQRSSYGV
jgi:hypothetical protein